MSIFPLEARNIAVHIRKTPIIKDVSLTLKGGGVHVLIGPNGAGKTTLMRALHGVQRISQGQIEWSVPAHQAQMAQGFVFQSPVMLRRSVLHNLTYPLTITGLRQAEAEPIAHDWAERFGLSGKLNQMAPSLSGGEQLKLALARALIRKPELVFLDEPSAALDGRSVREFEEAISRATSHSVTFMLCTHDMGQARRLADHVHFMYHGRIHEQAPADVFFNQPSTPEAQRFLRGDILE